jgi:DNA-binding CsgD family transcriptional regulator
MRQRGRDTRGSLLERERALAELARGIEAIGCNDGEGTIAAVAAPAGLGKTRLLEELASFAATREVTVLSARGVELETDFSFGVVHQLFDGHVSRADAGERDRIFAGAAALAAPLFGLAGAPVPDPTGFAVLNGLWWLLSAICVDRPVAVLVDDAHWVDAASARWLAFLAPRIAEIRGFVALAGRPEEPGSPPEWTALAAGGVPLEPLSPAATESLLTERLGTPPAPEFVQACRGATGGNPFLLTELARELAAHAVPPTRAEAAVVARVAPDTVARSVAARLAIHPPEVARLAGAVAVLGDDVGLSLAARLAGLDVSAAREAADVLIELGVLRYGSALRFEHPIVREAVYEQIGPVRRSGMHAAAAASLSDDVERRAMHLVRSEPCADEASVRTLREAAVLAEAAGSAPLAADCLARALAEPPAAADRPAVLAELGHAEILSGRPGALEHLREAVATADDPSTRGFAAAELARALQLTGDVDGAIALADERHELARGTAESLAIETELLTSAAIAGGHVWERLRPRMALRDAATESGVHRLELLALHALDELRCGGSHGAAGEFAAAALAGDVLLKRGTVHPAFLIASYVAARTAPEEFALGVLDRALDLARRDGSLVGFSYASLYRGALMMVRRSELDEAEADIRSAIEAGRDNGWPLLEWQGLGFLLILLAERGHVAAGQAELERGGFEGDLPSHGPGNALLSGRATLRYAQGRWRDAYEDFMEAGRREAPFTERAQTVWWRSDASMACAHLGDRADAIALAEAEVAVQLEFGDPIGTGRAFLARGMARGADGLDDLAEAVSRLEGVSDLYLTAALLELGAALRRAKRRSESREPLRRALEIAERIGAHGQVDRARTELAAGGTRARSVLRVGIDSLTPSELRISRLAADGLSNPQIAQELFVTRKTVEKHLASVFMKLDISSRSELPAMLAGGAAQAAP